ncbi:MAG: hypothetical protein JST16_07565 [Bdellovibrionales bacterium]|nr:hypothetical protein [Bdellovibrionales bacterium]
MSKLLSFFLVGLAGTAHAASSPDFQVRTTRYARPEFSAPTDCRAQIKVAMCLVDREVVGTDPLARTCLAGGENYAHFFEELYDTFPSALQGAFCSMRRIFIEKELSSTAYANALHTADGASAGAVVGIRQSLLDQKFSLHEWASWKEELSFGGHADSYQLTDGLPFVIASTTGIADGFLYFVMAHEIGHILDFANGVNQFDCPNNQNQNLDCSARSGSWSALSWETPDIVRAESEFYGRDELCFYECTPKDPEFDRLNEIYDGLWRSNFISAYAATNPYDDFAESLTYTLSSQLNGMSYEVHTGQGTYDNSVEKLGRDVFATKREWIKNFLAKPDLKYP